MTAAAAVAYTGVFVAFATAASPLLRDFPQGAGSFLALQPAGVVAWSDGRRLTLAFAAALAVLVLSAIAAIRAAAQAQAVHALPSRHGHGSAAALLADDVETLLARAGGTARSRAQAAARNGADRNESADAHFRL